MGKLKITKAQNLKSLKKRTYSLFIILDIVYFKIHLRTKPKFKSTLFQMIYLK